MDIRQLLVSSAFFSLGIAIFAVLPIVGRFISGFGLAGLLGLGVISLISVFLTHEDYKTVSILVVSVFWIVYILSAIQGQVQ